MNPAIVTVTLNPAIDHTAAISNFRAGEVNRVAWEQADPGGKGVNVASFLADFGFSVTATGILGQENAAIFEGLFDRKNIGNQFVTVPGRTRTNIKIIDEVQDQVTDINFPGLLPEAEDVQRLHEAIDRLASTHDWFILSGSLPAGMTTSIYADLIKRLKAQGKTVVLDASGESLRQAIPAAPFMVKPNLEELQEAIGRSLSTLDDRLEAARELLAQGISTVVISLGAEGALFVEAASAVWARPPQIEVISTVGAGDAMVSGFVTAKLRRLSLSDCARLATAFSIGALSQVGPRLSPKEVIESFVNQVSVEVLN
ncbi:1-phosphofructokinase [Leptolyngbya sp. FACHB-711]|uniref:1-phosphofructokinase n=1 Tax=unclassified Leptolyngbya TaxID=2650499 RepID=UPI0016836165|nr:1-phosphofructokinase [Leptolyngbya sp. FACHB-711]MBD1849296.1 1-phosphofructokinase [Cyanobacteria bacterium FACHB-502]MBD2027279.1 1-phosphofructokinase [Leptolyngbya sp. FACHB-711]